MTHYVIGRGQILGRTSEVVGGKALHLASVPPAWVPNFLVLNDAFAKAWAPTQTASTLVQSLGEVDAKVLHDLMNADIGTLTASRGLFIRSNSVSETNVRSRGKYQSISVDASLEALADALDRVMMQEPAAMRPLVQVGIDGVNGRLSNERRVSKSRTRAMIEGLPGEARSELKAAERFNPNKPLMASTLREARQRLAEALAWSLKAAEEYCAFEFVWDGEVVWIVQWEPVGSPISESWAAEYLRSRDELGQLRFKEPATPLNWIPSPEVQRGRWPKLNKSLTLVDAAIPTPTIWQLDGESWAGAAGKCVNQLLGLNPGTSFVVRTDVAGNLSSSPEMLPTSAPSADPEYLNDFMTKASRNFEAQGISRSDWAFLAAPLVRARASAMAYGVPGSTSSQVDALWGFPDGLLYHPHDNGLVPRRSELPVRKDIAYKPVCLLFHDHQWMLAGLGEPEDYANVLNDAELRTAGDWATRLAAGVGSEVQLMLLCRVGGRRGPDAMTAFHFTTDSIERPPGTPVPMGNSLQVISSPDDLDAAESTIGDTGAIMLRPATPLRDPNFLVRLAQVAKAHGVVIFFEGSLLGHAYHLMTNEGATVVPANPAPSLVAPATEYHKLVRDKIPAIVQRTGSVARVRPLSPTESNAILRQKLVEEALEVLSAESTVELIEELADVLEVFEALLRTVEDGKRAVGLAQERKRAQKGGFDDLVFLEFTQPTLVAAPIEAGVLPVNMGDASEEAPVAISYERTASFEDIRFDAQLVPPGRGAVLEGEHIEGTSTVTVSIEYDVATARIAVRVCDAPSQDSLGQLSLFEG